MFRIHENTFIGLLPSIGNAYNHTKFVSLNNQQCMIQPALINFHPYQHNHSLRYYHFVVNLDRHVGLCNTFNELFKKACVPNKTEDLNIGIFNMITWINELKTWAKHISCECKCTFDGRKYYSN